jgi:hypothetical protein
MYDAETGEQLWRDRLDSGGQSGVIYPSWTAVHGDRRRSPRSLEPIRELGSAARCALEFCVIDKSKIAEPSRRDMEAQFMGLDQLEQQQHVDVRAISLAVECAGRKNQKTLSLSKQGQLAVREGVNHCSSLSAEHIRSCPRPLAAVR